MRDPAGLLAVSLENTSHGKSLQDGSKLVLSFQMPTRYQHKAAALTNSEQDSQALGVALMIMNSVISEL